MRKSLGLWRGFVIPLFVAAAWEFAYRSELVNVATWTSPWLILRQLPSAVALDGVGALGMHSVGSLLAGVFVGAALGAFLALAANLYPAFADFVVLPLRALSPVPVVVWVPIAVLGVGTGRPLVMFMVAMAAFLVMFFESLRAFELTDEAYRELLQLYEKTKTFAAFHVMLPASIAPLWGALRLVLGLAWLTLFATEHGGSANGGAGLGWYIAQGRNLGRIEEVYCASILLAGLAILLDQAVLQGVRATREKSDDASGVSQSQR